MEQPADERVLRAKYLDWCSAKVAERFLSLTPDQIFELAHAPLPADETEGGRGVPHSVEEVTSPSAPSSSWIPPTPGKEETAPTSPDGGVDAVLGYAGLVARVTRVLARRIELPSFEEWLVAYRADPAAFESELLGFWRSPSRLSGGA